MVPFFGRKGGNPVQRGAFFLNFGKCHQGRQERAKKKRAALTVCTLLTIGPWSLNGDRVAKSVEKWQEVKKEQKVPFETALNI